jgi:hypothetical protein
MLKEVSRLILTSTYLCSIRLGCVEAPGAILVADGYRPRVTRVQELWVVDSLWVLYSRFLAMIPKGNSPNTFDEINGILLIGQLFTMFPWCKRNYILLWYKAYGIHNQIRFLQEIWQGELDLLVFDDGLCRISLRFVTLVDFCFYVVFFYLLSE